MRSALTLSVLACALYLSIASGSSKAEKRAQSEEPSESVTATAMRDAYRVNEVRADERFKGKVIRVTGTITGIGKGFGDRPFVVLDRAAQCEFSKGKAGSVAQLEKGKPASLKGVGKGSTLGVAMLEGCIVE